MEVFITKESKSTLITFKSSNGKTENYYINTFSNIIAEDDKLKIIIDNGNIKQDILIVDYDDINDKLGTSNLSDYLSEIGNLNYFTLPEIISSGGGSTDASDLTSGVLADARVQESNVKQHESSLEITESQISDLKNYLTDYTVTESDVKQHEAALEIDASQISNLPPITIEDDSITESKLTSEVRNKLNAANKEVQILTQLEYDSLDEATQNNGTLYLIQVSDTEFIYANNSGSTFDIATVKAIVETYTTENLVVSDSANDGNVLIYPDESNFTKTVTRTGEGISKIFAKAKTGYMSLVGDEVVRIGNGNININKSHATGILCRMNTDDLIGKSDNVVLLGTQEVNVNGKQHFSIGWGGANSPTTGIRNLVYVARAGVDNGTPVDIYDTITPGNGWSNNNNVNNLFKDAAKNTWVWIWAIGKNETDEITDYKTMEYNAGSSNFQGNNAISPLGKIHGSEIDMGTAYHRKKNGDVASYSIINGKEITSKNIEDSSLLIYTNGVNVDIASIVHINNFESLKTLCAISHGAHPEQLGIDLTDGFVINFGEQPSIVTVDAGTPIFNKSTADSPECFIYAGTNENNNPIEFNLKTIV